MSQMKPSATLQSAFDAIDVSRTSPVLNNMLVGALASRELIGLSRYGMTLDGQPGRDPFFWLRMAREEVADAVMYLQKAFALTSDHDPYMLAAMKTFRRETLELLAGLLNWTENGRPSDFAGVESLQALAEKFPPIKIEGDTKGK